MKHLKEILSMPGDLFIFKLLTAIHPQRHKVQALVALCTHFALSDVIKTICIQ